MPNENNKINSKKSKNNRHGRIATDGLLQPFHGCKFDGWQASGMISWPLYYIHNRDTKSHYNQDMVLQFYPTLLPPNPFAVCNLANIPLRGESEGRLRDAAKTLGSSPR